MKTEAVNSFFLSTVLRLTGRTLWCAVGDLLGPLNQWFFNVLLETLLLQKPWELPFNSFKRVRNQVCFAQGWGRHRLQCSTGGRRIWHPGFAISGISLEHELPVSLGQHWLQRDAGLRKSSPMPKTGFLVKNPSHQLVILRPLNCQVTFCKVAHGFGDSDTILEQDLLSKYSWLFLGI